MTSYPVPPENIQKMIYRSVVYRFLLLAGLFVVCSCQNSVQNKDNRQGSSGPTTGKMLAEQYCQGCHLLPEPGLINKANWINQVLPHMGPRLGIWEHNGREYPNYVNDPNLDPGYYPENALISKEDWQKILDYYESASPDTLPAARSPDSIRIEAKLPGFRVMKPSADSYIPATTFISFDTIGSLIIRGDALRRAVIFYDHNLNQSDAVAVPFAVSDIEKSGDSEILSTYIGELQPNNRKTGYIGTLELKSGKWQNIPGKKFEQLQRPVQTVRNDLNNDGYPDYLICEFGNLMGSLTLYLSRPGNTFERKVLKNLPGAIQIKLFDHNNDGLQDIWALFTQGDESIILFTNKGGGNFGEETILRFQPVFGSSYFELNDFNNDGLPDILYTAGDNGDFSLIMKPYHGVYIFLNDGENNFKQSYFFPLNGCFKAMAEDFDKDGDLDIAAIAYFADYALYPYEGFVYLENKGMLNFVPFTLKETALGRWLTMDLGDQDKDGWTDILLGNMSVGPTVSLPLTDWKKGAPFIVLRNTYKQRSNKSAKR